MIEGKLLLKPEEFKPSFDKWKVVGILNPGVVRAKNKKIVMYIRVSEEAGYKHKNLIKCPIMADKNNYKEKYENVKKKDVVKRGRWGEIYLKDGSCRLPHISHFKKITLDKGGMEIENIDPRPAFTGHPGEGEYGVEDARITKIKNKYYMTYVGVSARDGVSSYLAVSKDLNKWKRLGLIFREQNKDVMLFPEKINGNYFALNRPEATFEFTKPSIWLSQSKDLIYWGKDMCLMRPRPKGWDRDRLGGGAPPIKTKKGWLMIYHGVKDLESGSKYFGGAALLDLKDPRKVLMRSPEDKPLLEPGYTFEKHGFMNNVVFPTGVIEDLDKKHVMIYSGGADSIISVRRMEIADIFKHMRKVK